MTLHLQLAAFTSDEPYWIASAAIPPMSTMLKRSIADLVSFPDWIPLAKAGSAKIVPP